MPAIYRPDIPASGSSSTVLSLPAGTCLLYIAGYEYSMMPLIEDDHIYQLRQRKLRYAPFHVKNKSLMQSRRVINRPAVLHIMPKPVKIGRMKT